MPSLNISSPAISVLLPGLSPVAANPIGVIDAPAGNGFDAVIAGLAEGLMLDVPPSVSPGDGTPLPPIRPGFAGPPQPLPVLDVEQIMVGAGAVPIASVTPAQPLPAETVEPALPVPVVQEKAAPDSAEPDVVALLPKVAGQAQEPAAADSATPTLNRTTPYVAKHLPETIVSPAPEDAGSAPDQEAPAEEAFEQPVATTAAATPLAPTIAFAPVVWSAAPTSKPSAPMLAPDDHALPDAIGAATPAVVAAPLGVVDAPAPKQQGSLRSAPSADTPPSMADDASATPLPPLVP